MLLSTQLGACTSFCGHAPDKATVVGRSDTCMPSLQSFQACRSCSQQHVLAYTDKSSNPLLRSARTVLAQVYSAQMSPQDDDIQALVIHRYILLAFS